MPVNKPFIVAGIKNLLKNNYSIDPQTVDVEALVDDTLSYGENWGIIKDMISVGNINFEYFRCQGCEFKLKPNRTYCPNCSKKII